MSKKMASETTTNKQSLESVLENLSTNGFFKYMCEYRCVLEDVDVDFVTLTYYLLPKVWETFVVRLTSVLSFIMWTLLHLHQEVSVVI